MTDLLIVSTPFAFSYGPLLAPALLKSCAEERGISSTAWDLSAEFNHKNQSHEYYERVTAWLQRPESKLTAEEFEWYTNFITAAVDKIIHYYQPKTLAVSLLQFPCQRFSEDLCYHVKRQSDIKIIIGGGGADVFQHQYKKPWYQLMLDSKLCDTVIIGEGEISLPDAIINDTVGVVKVPQLTNDQLEQVPFPNYDDYDFSLYGNSTQTYWNTTKSDPKKTVFLITGSKGCVRDCNFCDVGKIWSKYRVRSGQRIAEEIMHLHRAYQANFFNFTDSLINGGLRTFLDMNTALAERLPDTIRYEGQFICRGEKEMPERYFESMARAGCSRVRIGMESGSERVRLAMGKGSSDADLEWTTKMLTKYGIQQEWNIFTGYPTETDEDWKRTMEIIKHHLDISNGLLYIYPVGTFQLLEGTPMMTPEGFKEFGLHQEIINGYGSFIWTSNINPTNTFDRRVERFRELCEFLIAYDGEHYGDFAKRLTGLDWQVEIYREYAKPKKVFKIAQT